MKKITNLLKKIGKIYVDSMVEYYRPLIENKVYPCN